MSNVISKRLKTSIQTFEESLQLSRTVLSRADEIDKWTHCYWRCFKRKAVKASSVFLFSVRDYKHRDFSFGMSFDFYDESEPRKHNQKSFPLLPIEEQTVRFSLSFNTNDKEDKQIDYSKTYTLEEAKILFKRVNKIIKTKLEEQKGFSIAFDDMIKIIDEEFFGNNEISIKKDEAFLEKMLIDDIDNLKVVIKKRDEAIKEKKLVQNTLKKRLKDSDAQRKVQELEAQLKLAKEELKKYETNTTKELNVQSVNRNAEKAKDLFDKESKAITTKAIKIAEENEISIRNIKIIKELINS
jgi:hypothetical protein